VIEGLNSLLRGELAAVAGYQKALRIRREKAFSDANELLHLASEHQRTVAVLHGFVHSRGGAPASADTSKGWDTTVLPSGGASLMLSREFVEALLEIERQGLAGYQAALGSLDDEARELVELELIPRQRRHVVRLSNVLLQLAA
jgi:hypothetical protein